jgi:hypothetical protein
MTYSPRGMPARFMEGAPSIVRKSIIDVIRIEPPAPLDFDVCLRDDAAGQMVGLDFDRDGARGCHFFLRPHEMRAYRERNRRKRVAWADLPAPTQAAILSYLESE